MMLSYPCLCLRAENNSLGINDVLNGSLLLFDMLFYVILPVEKISTDINNMIWAIVLEFVTKLDKLFYSLWKRGWWLYVFVSFA